MRLVLASSNRGKLAELNEAFRQTDIAFVPQSDFKIVDADETGMSFVENALIKARHASKYSQLPALADDSGLCVPALGGAPGIYSARYAGTGKDLDNNRKLLQVMKGFSGEARAAYFSCTLVFILNEQDPNPMVFQGIWQGEILEDLQGEQSFGYNPLFRPLDSQKSAAELSIEERNQVSHRAQALKKLFFFLNNRNNLK